MLKIVPRRRLLEGQLGRACPRAPRRAFYRYGQARPTPLPLCAAHPRRTHRGNRVHGALHAGHAPITVTHTVLNRVEPTFLGLPFFYIALFVVYTALIGVLIWAYRRGL